MAACFAGTLAARVTWADQLPEVYGTSFQPLQGGYFSVDPGDVGPGDFPETVDR